MCAVLFAESVWAVEDSVTLRSATDRLLRAYSAKDLSAVEKMLDSDILILGSDISERADSRVKVRELLEADFALWKGANFGEAIYTSQRIGGELGTVACDVPFSMRRAGDKVDTVVVRFLFVWRRVVDDWRLTQCMSAVPTVGQSAREILQRGD